MKRSTCSAFSFLGLALATVIAGCGGGGAAPAIPTPAITVSVSATTGTVQAGGTALVTATVSNDPSNKGVTWTISPASGAGTLSNMTSTSVTYHAPSTPPANDVPVTITATSVADPSMSGSTTIIFAAITVSLSAATGMVEAGGTVLITATVNNDPSNKGVTPSSWTISPATGAGSLSNMTSTSATYKAPTSVPASDVTVTITATSAADPTKSGSTTIIFAAITVSVSPNPASVAEDTMQQFTAAVQFDPASKGATWTLTQGGAACSPGCGTLSNQTSTSVTYNAPGTVPANPTVTLTATSVTDPTKSGAAIITVVNPDAELNGHYAFLFDGFDDATGEQVAVAASFTADGFGNITNGVEDINAPSGAHASVTFTGTYIIGLDNRGTAAFTNSLGGSVTYAFAVGSLNGSGVATKVRLIEFDDTTGTNGTRGSGVMRLQDSTAFSQSSISGPYAFGFDGQDPSGKRRAVAGVFTADGAGKITGGTEDVNDAGTVTKSVAFTGTYTTPSSTNGRATVTLTSSGSSSNQSVYVVSASELLVISTDAISSAGLTSGTELSQASTSFSNSSLNASAVFYQVGVNSASPATQSNVEIGLFSANGSGGLSLTFDANNGGTITSNTTTSGLTSSVASNGRVTISGGTGSQPILYLVDANKAFFLDTGGSVGFGFVEPQSGGPFSGSSIKGMYFFGAAPPAVTASTVSSGVATGGSHRVRFAGAVPSASISPMGMGIATTAFATASYWLVLSSITVLFALVASSRRRGSRNERVWAYGAALLIVLGLAGCRTVFTLSVTQDSSSSNGTLTADGAGSSQLTVSSNGRTTTTNSGVIYIISPNKFVLIDSSASDTAPTVQIFEQ